MVALTAFRTRSLGWAAVLIAAAVGLVTLDRGSRCEPVPADPRSVKWFVSSQPQRVRALFDSLNLDRPGLESVRRAVMDDDYTVACEALLAYYRTVPTARWLRREPVAESDRRDARAEALISDVFTFYNTEGKLPRTRGGTIDWSYNGPRNDPEWGWSLNDLHHLNALTQAYFKTGRREYIVRVDADVRDWVLSNPYPGRATRRGPWRGIDVAARARNWMHTFYTLQKLDEFSPAARLLMLSSLSEHAQYLLLFHRREAGNWAVGELSGLAAIGAAWPEFDDAPGWRAYTLERMGWQMTEQVYPDGAQSELSSIYHRITTETFDRFIDTFREFGFAVPDSLRTGVQKMWSYLALTVRPDGTTAENNDSDRRDVREKLIGAAKSHNRPDWVYAATNGASGVAPSSGPSVKFPWAGQVVMRSGWDAGAHWSFFDVGPSGTAHQHRDKLHVSIDAFGRALLVDSGRYNYQRGRFRNYFTGSAAHNVIRVDGGDQKMGPERAVDPIATGDYGSTAEWDYARGIFGAGYAGVRGQAVHTRTVIYLRHRLWIVADRMETDRPRAIEALWHFAPDCAVAVEDRSVVTTDEGKGNLRVMPVGGMRWKVEVVAGREHPEIQGWYSGYYNEKVPAPTAVYTAEIPGTTTFIWILVPGMGAVPAPSATVLSSRPERVELRVQTNAGESYIIAVPMNTWRPSVRREG